MSCRGPTEASYGYLPVTASSSVSPRLLHYRWQSAVHSSLKRSRSLQSPRRITKSPPWNTVLAAGRVQADSAEKCLAAACISDCICQAPQAACSEASQVWADQMSAGKEYGWLLMRSGLM